MQSKLIGTVVESDAAKYFMVIDPEGDQIELFVGRDGGLVYAKNGKWQGMTVPAGKTAEDIYSNAMATATKNGGNVVEMVK